MSKAQIRQFCKQHNLTAGQFYGRVKIGGYLYLSSLTSTEAERELMIANIVNAEAALEFMQDGEVIPYDVGINGLILEETVVDGIILSRKPEVGMELTHRDFSIGKRRITPLRLCIHKIYDGKVVAHQAGHEPDADGHYAQLYLFPLGIREEDTTWE